MSRRRTKTVKAMKRLRIKAAALLTAALLCGCSASDTSLDSLLSPPKLTEYQTAIYNALIQSTGDKLELTYPRSGDYRSAFVIYDLDDEPTSEAIVFYRVTDTPDGEGGLRMSFLDQQDGQWFSVLDRPLAGMNVEAVSFSDFGRGTDIVVRCSVLSQTEQMVNVLSYEDGEVEELYRGNCVFFDASDLDADGFSELFLINYDAALGCHTAHLLSFYENEERQTVFGAVSSISLNADMVTVQRMNRQRLGDSDSLLFLDYSKGSGIFGTQLLRCYGKNLTWVYSEGLTRRNNANTPTLYCTDIDRDGMIEIPVTSPLPGYENLTIPEQIYSVDWYYADEESAFTITREYSAYVSAGMEYMFYIPVRWQGLVTAEKTPEAVSFVRYDPENEEPDVLLSVSISQPDGTGWRIFGESDSVTVYVNTYGGEMALTEDELQSCLMLL